MKPELVSSLKLALQVMVVAPGAGTGLNGEVYKELGEDAQIKALLTETISYYDYMVI